MSRPTRPFLREGNIRQAGVRPRFRPNLSARRRTPKVAPIDGNVEAPPQSTSMLGAGIDATVGTEGRDPARDGLTTQSSENIEGDWRRAAREGTQATQSRDRRIDAFIVALGCACLGKPWYTSTKELQLASLQFCLACRSAPTLRVIVDEDVPIRLLIDRVTLKHYWHSEEPNRSRVPSVQYHALNTMTWMMPPEFLKTAGEILEHVRSLTIDDDQNRAAIGAVYPRNLKVLRFGPFFNRSMKNSSLPMSLQELTFGRKFNQRLDNFSWPNSLQRVTLGTNFNKPICRVQFPASLQYITFKGHFDQEIEQVSWPRDLQELDLGMKFNQRIDKVKWPPSLQKIVFGFRFNQRIDRTAWPLRLRELILDYKFDQEIILPPSLKHLTLHLPSDSPLPAFPGVVVSRGQWK
ncbi:unnamed protein product [Ectocarpus fasciculatus]